MALYMMGNGISEEHMATANLFGRMEIHMMVSGTTIRDKVKEFLKKLMALTIRVSG